MNSSLKQCLTGISELMEEVSFTGGSTIARYADGEHMPLASGFAAAGRVFMRPWVIQV